MSKTVTIEVTQEDIDNGRPEDCEKCAIALAVRRVCGARKVAVDGVHIGWVNGGAFAGITPPRASEFIEKFDRHEQVEPFSFSVEAEDGEWLFGEEAS